MSLHETMTDEQARINFKCPYCGVDLSFPETRRGTVQDCPYCQRMVVVTSGGSAGDGRLPIPVKTARLNLRSLDVQDQPDWLEFITDEESHRFLEDNPPDEDEARQWLENSKTIRLTDPKGYLLLAV